MKQLLEAEYGYRKYRPLTEEQSSKSCSLNIVRSIIAVDIQLAVGIIAISCRKLYKATGARSFVEYDVLFCL